MQTGTTLDPITSQSCPVPAPTSLKQACALSSLLKHISGYQGQMRPRPVELTGLSHVSQGDGLRQVSLTLPCLFSRRGGGFQHHLFLLWPAPVPKLPGLPASRGNLEIHWDCYSSPDYEDQFLWRQWRQWKMDCMTPLLPKPHLPPPNYPGIPQSILGSPSKLPFLTRKDPLQIPATEFPCSERLGSSTPEAGNSAMPTWRLFSGQNCAANSPFRKKAHIIHTGWRYIMPNWYLCGLGYKQAPLGVPM